jgi:prophage regulatory protein
MPTYLRMRQLATTPGRQGRLPLAPSTLWRWTATGQFPKPVPLSPGVSAWPIDVIEQWERDHAAALKA